MKTPSKNLFNLIKTLTKSEKRYFKIEASKHGGDKKNHYVKLFDAIEAMNEYDEEALKKKFRNESFVKHLFVTKNYLYKLIMKSLRSYSKKDAEQFGVQDTLRDANILLDKGLVDQHNKLLGQARKQMVQNENHLQLLEIYARQHTMIHKMNDLKALESYVNDEIEAELNELEKHKNLLMYQWLNDKVFLLNWKIGRARNEEERQQYLEVLKGNYFKNNQPLSLLARFYYLNAHSACHYSTGQIDDCYQYRKQLIQLFEENQGFARSNSFRYIGALNNLFVVQREKKDFEEGLKTLAKLRSVPKSTIRHEAEIFSLSYILEFDLYCLSGQFEKGAAIVDEIQTDFNKHLDLMDKAHQLATIFGGAAEQCAQEFETAPKGAFASSKKQPVAIFEAGQLLLDFVSQR